MKDKTTLDGKMQPQAIELEEAVLGAAMLENEALSVILDILRPEHFYKEAHRAIFSAIVTLFNGSGAVDILTVSNQLKNSGNLDLAGGAYYISQLTQRVASSANVEFHARIILQKHIQRELIRISTEVIQKAYSDEVDVFDIIDETEQRMSDILGHITNNRIESSEELYQKSLEHNDFILGLNGEIPGISSGFRAIDRLTGGWQEADLIILAGATSMGKTALGLDCVLDAALKNKPIGLFSLEMPNTQLYARLQSKVSNIEHEIITKTGIPLSDMPRFKEAVQLLRKAPIFLDDTTGLSIFQLKSRARRMKKKFHIEMIMVDYLQLMEGEKRGNREQEIASISRGLKGLAKELKIPIIALSQLSRDIEKRSDKEPKLSDLRESGSIEQDADVVMFVYRPEYYGIFFSEDQQSLRGKAKAMIKKNRHGSWGDVKLDFEGQFMRFSSEGVRDIKPIKPEQANLNFEESTDIIS